MNVDIFVLYIFSRYSRLSNVHEDMYIMKITFIMPDTGNNIKNANLNPREIANFRKYVKITVYPPKISIFTVIYKEWLLVIIY